MKAMCSLLMTISPPLLMRFNFSKAISRQRAEAVAVFKPEGGRQKLQIPTSNIQHPEKLPAPGSNFQKSKSKAAESSCSPTHLACSVQPGIRTAPERGLSSPQQLPKAE